MSKIGHSFNEHGLLPGVASTWFPLGPDLRSWQFLGCDTNDLSKPLTVIPLFPVDQETGLCTGIWRGFFRTGSECPPSNRGLYE